MGSAIITVEDVQAIFANEDKKTWTVLMNNRQRHVIPAKEAKELAKAVEAHNKSMDDYYKRNGGLDVAQQKPVSNERSRAEQRVSALRGDLCREAFQKRRRD